MTTAGNTNEYSSKTLMGNWSEDRTFHEKTANQFLKDYEKGTLELSACKQKIQKATKPIKLEGHKTILYGDYVVLQNNAVCFNFL